MNSNSHWIASRSCWRFRRPDKSNRRSRQKFEDRPLGPTIICSSILSNLQRDPFFCFELQTANLVDVFVLEEGPIGEVPAADLAPLIRARIS
jgi:hypothetical protein